MKTLFRLFAVIALIAIAVPTQAQFVRGGAPTLYSALTNLSGDINYTNVFSIGAVGAASSTNIVSPATNAGPHVVNIPAGFGVGFGATLGTTNLGTTATVYFLFDLSMDTTNWTTGTNTAQWTFGIPLNGMTQRTAFTNFPASFINGASQIRLHGILNDNTNLTFLTNAYISTYQ